MLIRKNIWYRKVIACLLSAMLVAMFIPTYSFAEAEDDSKEVQESVVQTDASLPSEADESDASDDLEIKADQPDAPSQELPEAVPSNNLELQESTLPKTSEKIEVPSLAMSPTTEPEPAELQSDIDTLAVSPQATSFIEMHNPDSISSGTVGTHQATFFNYLASGQPAGHVKVHTGSDYYSGSSSTISDVTVGDTVGIAIDVNEGYLLNKIGINGTVYQWNAASTWWYASDGSELPWTVLIGSFESMYFPFKFTAELHIDFEFTQKQSEQSTIFLDDGTYGTDYKQSKGTIEYSVDNGITWNGLDQGTTQSGTGYVLPSKNGFMLRTQLVNPAYTVEMFNDAGQPVAVPTAEGVSYPAGSYHMQINDFVTVRWAYAEGVSSDDIVTGGRIAQLSWVGADGLPVVVNDSAEGGYAMIPAGAEVTAILQPNYGYQFIAGGFNGGTLPVEAGAAEGQFTFTMPATNLHFAATFSPVSDEALVSSPEITTASLSKGQNATSTGTLRLDVASLQPSSEQQQAMQDALSQAGSRGQLSLMMDLKLSRIINKGNSTQAWETMLSDLNEDVVVGVKPEMALDPNATYEAVRIHNGASSVIPATYNAETGEVNFATDGFSEYALAITPASSQPKALDTDRPASNVVVSKASLARTGDESLAAIAFLCAALLCGFLVACGSAQRTRKDK